VILVVAFVWYNNREETTESFITDSSKELDSYFAGSTVGVKDYLVDTMTCDPSCCGDQWPTPFDGLTGPEIQKCIKDIGEPSDYVRTNYTCANGENGVGCPCIKKKAWLFLTNRGNNVQYNTTVPESFLIRNDIVYDRPDPMTPYQELQQKKSVRVDNRKLNDVEVGRRPESVKGLRSATGIPSKDTQLAQLSQ